MKSHEVWTGQGISRAAREAISTKRRTISDTRSAGSPGQARCTDLAA